MWESEEVSLIFQHPTSVQAGNVALPQSLVIQETLRMLTNFGARFALCQMRATPAIWTYKEKVCEMSKCSEKGQTLHKHREGQKQVYSCEYTKHRVYSCSIIYLLLDYFLYKQL